MKKSESVNIEKLFVLFYASLLSGIGYLVFQVLVDIFRNQNLEISGNYLGVSSFYLFLLGLIILFFFIKLLKKERLSDFGFDRFKTNDIRFVLLLFSLFFIVSVLSRIITPGFDVWYSTRLRLFDVNTLMKLLVVVVPISIVVEELITRSMIQSFLSKYFGSKASVFVVTVYFTLFHLGWLRESPGLSYSLAILISTLLFSFLAAILYERTKSVILTILFHLMVNSINLIQIFLHKINNPLEMLLWFLWGALFFVFFKRSIKALDISLKALKSKKMNNADIIYLVLISIIPMLLIIL